ncbi:MAG TPA: PAS domain-containing protein [Myxococcales bacterium]|nr:PAS domain-containing protein [Myxococcales bacterium]
MPKDDATSELAILGLSFKKIDSMTPEALDKLPFGAIQLDEQGKVKAFNIYESNLSHMPKSSVIGKDFFRDVAPCTDVKEFRGQFQQGFADKHLHAKFNYHFAFKQKPRDVSVTLFYSSITATVWVFVQPR